MDVFAKEGAAEMGLQKPAKTEKASKSKKQLIQSKLMAKAQAGKSTSKKGVSKKVAKKEDASLHSKPLPALGDLFFDEAVPAEDMQAAFENA